MRQRLARFMAGRNGSDSFNMFLLVVGLILVLLSSLFGGTAGKVMMLLVAADLGFAYFRMLSRNIYRRREENEKYLRTRYKVTAQLRLLRERWVQRKDYKFFRCSECGTTLRVPRGHNKIRIVCRKCGHSFIGKS